MADALSIRWVSSVADISAELWNHCFAPPVEGRWWYEAMEKSGLGGQFTFFYAVISRGDEAVGIAPAFLMDVPIDLVAPPLAAKLLRFFGTVVPRLRYQRTLFVGSPCSDEGTVGLLPGVSLKEVAPILQAALEIQARNAKAPMIVWKDFLQSESGHLSPLVESCGMFKVVSYPGAKVQLPGGGFEGWAKTLPSQRRYNLKRKLKLSRQTADLVPSVIQHPDAKVLDEIFPLFWQTYEKGKTKFEKLTREFFDRVAAEEAAHWIVLRRAKDGRPVAFMLLFLTPPRAINKFIGLDYSLEGDWYLYFRLWEQAVEWASNAGATELQSGQTGYRAKLDLCHELVGLDNYCRHQNAVIHAVFAKVARGITWATLDPDLKTHVEAPSKKKAEKPGGSDLLLRLIGAFKLFKGLLLAIVGFVALRMMHRDVAVMVQGLADYFHVDPDSRYLQWLLVKVTGISPRRIQLLGAGAFIYAGLFLTEGIGLMFGQTWAEWLSVVSTALLLPLEIYEIIRRVRVTRIIVLLLNVAIVVFLIKRLRRQSKEKSEAKTTAKPRSREGKREENKS